MADPQQNIDFQMRLGRAPDDDRHQERASRTEMRPTCHRLLAATVGVGKPADAPEVATASEVIAELAAVTREWIAAMPRSAAELSLPGLRIDPSEIGVTSTPGAQEHHLLGGYDSDPHFQQLLADAAAIGSRFTAEPLFARTGEGFLQSRGTAEVEAARRKATGR